MKTIVQNCVVVLFENERCETVDMKSIGFCVDGEVEKERRGEERRESIK